MYCKFFLLQTEIFGFADFTQMGHAANDVPINGIFRGTRTVFTGMLRISTLMPPGIMPINFEAEGVFVVPTFGTLNRVAPGVYLTTRDSMMPYFPFFASVDETGELQYLTMAYWDMVSSSTASVAFDLVTVALLLLAGVYGLIALVGVAISKIRKKEQTFTKLRFAMYAVLPLVLVNLLVLVMQQMAFRASLTSNMVQGLLFIVFALMICAIAVAMLLQLKQNDLSKKQKRQLIVPSVMGIIMLANIIYWQLFMFWV